MGKRKRIDKRYEKVVPGKDKKIVTGIPTIDQALKDGMPSGVITSIAGIGKSSYVDQIKRQLREKGEAIITLEMPSSYYEDKLKKYL